MSRIQKTLIVALSVILGVALGGLVGLSLGADLISITDLESGTYTDGQSRVFVDYGIETAPPEASSNMPNAVAQFLVAASSPTTIAPDTSGGEPDPGGEDPTPMEEFVLSMRQQGMTIKYEWWNLSETEIWAEGEILPTFNEHIIFPAPAEWDTLHLWIDNGIKEILGAILSFRAYTRGIPIHHGIWIDRHKQYVFEESISPSPPDTLDEGSYLIDEDFSPDQLTPDQRLWYDRIHEAAAGAWADGSAAYRERARSNDSYQLSRFVNLTASGFLSALRATGSPAMLDSVHVLLADMKEDLRDEWADGTTDGYLGWWWQEPGQWNGTDTHGMDEALLHSWLSEAVYALHVNRNEKESWASLADFYKDYLINHFEAKWVERAGSQEEAWREQGAGFYKSLWHPYASLARMAHFFWLLYGDEWHRDERDRVLGDWRADAVLLEGERHAWPHRVHDLGDLGYQKLNYARYTIVSLLPLMHEGIVNEGEAEKLSNTLAHCLGVGGPDSMAERVDGSGVVGLDPSSFCNLGIWGNTSSFQDAAEVAYNPGSSISMYMSAFMLSGAGGR